MDDPLDGLRMRVFALEQQVKDLKSQIGIIAAAFVGAALYLYFR